jgi:prepilin-type N-terminal cleavage/methylation domain-containing protein
MISNKKTGQSGFTLLELLVVLFLMALLMALVVGAVFRVLGEQREKNTGIHLHKIQMMLDQQYKAKMDEIRKESPPQAVVEATRNADGSIDMDRAKAFHMKMRLRQEFPQNFADLLRGPFSLSYGGQTYVYRTKPAYLAAVKSPYMPTPTQYEENGPEHHSAALLVLILSQVAGGAGTDPESIAPTKLLDYSQGSAPGVRSGSSQLRVFVDSFGEPIAFRRLADDDMSDVLAELNQQPFVSQEQIATSKLDPTDPKGRLKQQVPVDWPNRILLSNMLAYPNAAAPSRPKLDNPFDGFNRGPFAFSGGKNKRFYNTSTFAWEANGDNLYSYRIQQAGKGN